MKTQENDGTEIVPNAELQLIIKANALPDDLGNVIQEKFSGAFAQLDEWKTKADGLVITSEDQVAEIALANDGRKTLLKIRTSLEKTRVELKAPYLNMGRAIDAVCKSLTERIAPIEEDLKTKAEYAVNLAAERKARLVAERRAALIEVGHSGDMPALGEMEESTFQMLLEGAKAQAQRVREQQEREAAELAAAQESERLEAERLANRERLGQSRRLELVQLGAKIHGGTFNTYNLGEVTVQDSRLFDMGDSEWADCLADFSKEAKRIADEEAQQRLIEQRTNDRKWQVVGIGATTSIENEEAMYWIGTVYSSHTHMVVASDDEWAEKIAEFQNEADRLVRQAAERTARKDRFQGRVKTLIALGAKEINDGENDRLELGNSKVMLDALYSLNEEDERWTFTLQSFQDEAARLKQLADQVALQERERLQTANDRLASLRNVDFATTFDAVADLTDTEFDALLKVKMTEHNARKAAQERADRGRTRKELALAVGEDRSWEFLADLTSDEWESFYANAKRLRAQADQDRANEAAQAKIEAQRKAEADRKANEEAEARKRAAAAPDKDKLNALIAQLELVEIPVCTTIQGEAIAKGAQKRIAALIDEITAAVAQM